MNLLGLGHYIAICKECHWEERSDIVFLDGIETQMHKVSRSFVINAVDHGVIEIRMQNLSPRATSRYCKYIQLRDGYGSSTRSLV